MSVSPSTFKGKHHFSACKSHEASLSIRSRRITSSRLGRWTQSCGMNWLQWQLERLILSFPNAIIYSTNRMKKWWCGWIPLAQWTTGRKLMITINCHFATAIALSSITTKPWVKPCRAWTWSILAFPCRTSVSWIFSGLYKDLWFSLTISLRCSAPAKNEPICKATLHTRDMDLFRYAIANNYWYQMFIGTSGTATICSLMGLF